MYNVSNLIKTKNLIKPKNKKMTENQYSNLLKYLNKKRNKNLRSAAKNRFMTAQRPNFSHFGTGIKRQTNAWEDYSHNPRTTRKLVNKIRNDMSKGFYRKQDDSMKLDSSRVGFRLKMAFIKSVSLSSPNDREESDV